MSTPPDAVPAGVAHPRPIRSFVTRAGRTTAGQARALAVLGPRHVLPYDPSTTDLVAACADPASAGGQNRSKTVLEIGFGMGHATVHLAADEQRVRHQRRDVRGGVAHAEADLQHGF